MEEGLAEVVCCHASVRPVVRGAVYGGAGIAGATRRTGGGGGGGGGGRGGGGGGGRGGGGGGDNRNAKETRNKTPPSHRTPPTQSWHTESLNNKAVNLAALEKLPGHKIRDTPS